MYFGLIDGNMKHFDKEPHVIIATFHWQCSIKFGYSEKATKFEKNLPLKI